MAKRKLTLADVANEAGVSIMTVSRVVNNRGEISEATRQQVQSVIDRMQYRPNRAARSLVTDRTYAIGVVVPDITNPYFANIVRGVEDEAWKHGYNILLNNTVEQRNREEAALHLLEETGAEGLVLCSPRLPSKTLYALIQRHSQVVIMNRDVPGHLGTQIRALNSARLLQFEYMAKQGYKRLAMLHHGSYDTLAGKAIQVARETLDVCIEEAHIFAVLPTWESGYAWMNEHHDQIINRIDGLICSNDLIALGVLRACQEHGIRIPDDLAIIGNDDILPARMASPALTTLTIPQYRMGQAATQALLANLLDNFETTIPTDFQFELIIRESA